MSDARQIVTAIAAADRGDRAAVEQLFSSLYRELHRLAQRQLHRNAGGITLSATTLLHEAYLDLSAGSADFPDRGTAAPKRIPSRRCRETRPSPPRGSAPARGCGR